MPDEGEPAVVPELGSAPGHLVRLGDVALELLDGLAVDALAFRLVQLLAGVVGLDPDTGHGLLGVGVDPGEQGGQQADDHEHGHATAKQGPRGRGVRRLSGKSYSLGKTTFISSVGFSGT